MAATIIFTLVSLISASLTLLVTSISTVILINHLRHTRDVVLLLLTNTYLTMFLFSFLVLLINAQVIVVDLNGFRGFTSNQLTACHVEGFAIFLAFGLCFISFIVQAFYRSARVIYPKHKFLQVCHRLKCSCTIDVAFCALITGNSIGFRRLLHQRDISLCFVTYFTGGWLRSIHPFFSLINPKELFQANRLVKKQRAYHVMCLSYFRNN